MRKIITNVFNVKVYYKMDDFRFLSNKYRKERVYRNTILADHHIYIYL